MAIKCINNAYAACQPDYKHEFICDSEADVANLPDCCTGSMAVVAATGEVYIVNASGNWVKFGG